MMVRGSSEVAEYVDASGDVNSSSFLLTSKNFITLFRPLVCFLRFVPPLVYMVSGFFKIFAAYSWTGT